MVNNALFAFVLFLVQLYNLIELFEINQYYSLTMKLILEKEMATHSSILAWIIPGTEEPGGLPSIGSHKSQTWLKRLSSNSPQTEQFFSLILDKISVQQNKKFSRPCIFERLYHSILFITCTEQHNKWYLHQQLLNEIFSLLSSSWERKFQTYFLVSVARKGAFSW